MVQIQTVHLVTLFRILFEVVFPRYVIYSLKKNLKITSYLHILFKALQAYKFVVLMQFLTFAIFKIAHSIPRGPSTSKIFFHSTFR